MPNCKPIPERHVPFLSQFLFLAIFVCLPAIPVLRAAGEEAPVLRLMVDKPPAAEMTPGIEASMDPGLPADIQKRILDVTNLSGTKEQSGSRETAIQEALERQRSFQNEDGTRVVENFDASDKRMEKRLLDAQERLLQRWVFDPAQKGRIMRYETYTYKKGDLKQYRIAEWEYESSGAVEKINYQYNGKDELTGILVEYTGPEGVKFLEEWYDDKENPAGRRIWDPKTGEFREHILIKPAFPGMKRIEWLNEDGNVIRREVLSGLDKLIPFVRVRLGKSYDAGDYRHLEAGDRAARRPRSGLL